MVYNHGKTGEIVAAVSQDPQAMAFNALATCYNYIVAGVEPESTHLLTESDILTPDNLAETLPDSVAE